MTSLNERIGGRRLSRPAFATAAASLATAVAMAAPATAAAASVEYRTVALSGASALGAGGAVYAGFSAAAINDAGEVAYQARLGGAGVVDTNDVALYAALGSGGGAAQLVARESAQAPGAPGGVHYGDLEFSFPIINDAGQVAFPAYLSGAGVNATNDRSIYAGPPAGPILLARAGNPAPGPPANVHYGLISQLAPTAFSDAGRAAFFAELAGPGVGDGNHRVIVAAGGAGAPRIVARQGDAAPGTSPGVRYFDLREGFGATAVSINDSGEVGFVAALGPGLSLENGGLAIYAGAADALTLAARTGQRAPGTPSNVLYADFGAPTLNDAGQIAYRAILQHPGVTDPGREAIYAGSPADPQLVARMAGPVPGAPAGLTYGFLEHPTINETGRIAFHGTINGPGTTDDWALFSGSFASPQLLVREGDAAPGTPVGVEFSRFFGPGLTDEGLVAFFAELAGPGVTSATNLGVFTYQPDGTGVLVAREGDAFNVGDGSVRTIAGIAFISGRGDDVLSGVGAGDRLALSLQFTDRSSGIFVATVPEPVSLAALGLTVGTVVTRSRRRRRDGLPATNHERPTIRSGVVRVVTVQPGLQPLQKVPHSAVHTDGLSGSSIAVG